MNREEAQRAIEELWTSYDPSQLPLLGRFLAHPDAEVRTAAREGIVQLGAPGGVELLRAAAEKTTDVEEARALRKAADFLALPAWTDRKRRAGDAAKAPSKPTP